MGRPLTVPHLLMQGMLAGLLAGILAIGFARVFGEPQVDRAIAFEEQQVHAAAGPDDGDHHEEEVVSRGVQSGIGLVAAIGLFSIAAGGIFGLVFAFAQGRLGTLRPRVTAALLALGGLVVLYLVPVLKYPVNPPAVGDPETITRRTELFFGMMLISLLVAIAAVRLGRQLLPRLGGWNAGLLAGAVFLVAVGVAQQFMPAVNEVPDGFPATVLWQFRLASLGTQAVLWGALGLFFGALVERSLQPKDLPGAASAPAEA